MPLAFALLMLFAPLPAQAFLGTDVIPLMKLVSGQIVEIERLTENLHLMQENRQLLIDLNQGINRTVAQIQSIQEVIIRAQGLSPTAIRSLSELNDYLDRVHDAKRGLDEVLGIRLKASQVAVQQAALQSETAYLMGQEMIGTGAQLARESQTARPGRAEQLAAAAASAQVLGQGVQLQTLAQMIQSQGVQLELIRARLEGERNERDLTRSFFKGELASRKGVKR